MPTKEDVLSSLENFKFHVKNYNENFRDRNKLPKNFDWRPYRWCSRDIVFSLMVVRHCRAGNYLEVDVCLITNPPQYVENSGAKVALGFLLSEAFKCGGSMEIVFTRNVEGGRVPAYICDFAIECGIKLTHVFEGHLSPWESRQLYLALAGFSENAKNRIMKMAVEKKISPERACFVVLGGVWSLPEAESIILTSRNPERVLASLSEPGDRHLYLADLTLAKNVILGGVLDRKLLKAEVVENGEVLETEDVEAPWQIDFDPTFFARVYQSEADMIVPWISEEKILRAGQKLIVLVRARSDKEIMRYVVKDLKSLQDLALKYKSGEKDALIAYLTPRDFDDIPSDEKEKIMDMLEEQRVYLMVSPESMAAITKEAIRRLETGRVIRK